MADRKKGGQPGNDNSSLDNRAWGRAIRRKIAQNPEHLDAVASALFAEAMDGNIQAIKELGDRLDGKPKQGVEIEGGDKPLVHRIERKIVDNADE